MVWMGWVVRLTKVERLLDMVTGYKSHLLGVRVGSLPLAQTIISGRCQTRASSWHDTLFQSMKTFPNRTEHDPVGSKPVDRRWHRWNVRGGALPMQHPPWPNNQTLCRKHKCFTKRFSQYAFICRTSTPMRIFLLEYISKDSETWSKAYIVDFQNNRINCSKNYIF